VSSRTSISKRTSQRAASLSDEVIRRLVIEITNRGGVEGFVRRMMKLREAVKAGRDEQVAQISGESKERSYRRLMSAVNEAVKRGTKVEALKIVFYAARYAYENSQEHGQALMSYLSRFTEDCS
jgi:hypothetical protein